MKVTPFFITQLGEWFYDKELAELDDEREEDDGDRSDEQFDRADRQTELLR